MTILKKLLKEPLGAAGLAIVLFWLIVALFAPLIAPPTGIGDPYLMIRQSYLSVPTPPGEGLLFGATGGGYDIFYGIVWGARTAFLIGFTVVVSTAAIGMLIGGISAYRGKKTDYVLMRIVDLFMSIPFLIAVIVMTIVLGKGIEKIIIALIVFGWSDYARVFRSEVLAIKQREYVMAARVMGASNIKIFFNHILPNSFHPIIVLMSINFGKMVLIAAAMGFIGIGTEPGYADWGQLINYSRSWITGIPGSPFQYWYTYLYPSIAIFTFVLGWTLMGDAFRDVMEE